MKKVVYIGNFIPKHSTETYIARTFEDIGWEVIRCQEDMLNIKTAIEESKDADFLLWTRTWLEKQNEVKQILDKINIPTVTLHLDLYFGLDREPHLDKELFWKTDYVFTADGGHQKEFKAKGINHYFLSPGVYKPECYEGKHKSKYAYDVCFLGSYDYHKEYTYRQKLIKWLDENFNFHLFTHSDRIWGNEKNDLFASAKIIMGDSCYSPNYFSDRIPETLGRGGFLIHPDVPGLNEEYPYYKTFIPYTHNDWSNLKKIIDYYLVADDERNKIRKTGMDHVIENHTWINKINNILKIIND